MATQLDARIKSKYDTYENWVTNDPVLLEGEIAIAELASRISTTPTLLLKVGDGKNNYSALPFVSANAADVYEWAKAAEKPNYEYREILNKPTLNGITIEGDKTSEDYGIRAAENSDIQDIFK
jgi:hypothetical protein